MEETQITGQVLRIVFQRGDYAIASVRIIGTPPTHLEPRTMVVGTLPELVESETYDFIGHVVEHPTYGWQWQVESFHLHEPDEVEHLVEYFSSERFAGVGKKTAESIIETLGKDAIAKIKEDPSCLDEVPKLRQKQKEVLIKEVQAHYGKDQILLELRNLGLSGPQAEKIYKKEKQRSLAVIQKNPYQLLKMDLRISFDKVDHIARELGIEATDQRRLQAGVEMVLQLHCYRSGDTYLDLRSLLETAQKELEKGQSEPIDIALIQEAISDLLKERKLYFVKEEESQVYLPTFFDAETSIVFALQRLAEAPVPYSEDEIDQAIQKLEKKSTFRYGNSQKRALKKAMQHNVFILTGGPGTGKTTIIKAILELYSMLEEVPLEAKNGEDTLFHLAAPTGRAARRMHESTGLPAATIHRMLGLGLGEEVQEANREIRDGIVIVDEFSMVDTLLCKTLLEAIDTGVKVIFVGDHFQLPSVGPGQILGDLLASEVLPFEELQDIYRQSEDSTIIDVAHEVCQGVMPQDFTAKKADRSYFERLASELKDSIQQIVEVALKKGYSAKTLQVLAPTYNGEAGIHALNQTLQQVMNPDFGKKEPFVVDQCTYYEGDKIINLENDVENNVFNGDIGFVTAIQDGKLWVDFEGNEVSFTKKEKDRISLAYCCSIHKSQGSEYDSVIIPMVNRYPIPLLKRNLLYTAITRAKKSVIFIGEEMAFQRCIETPGNERKTGLIYHLHRVFGEPKTEQEEKYNAEVEEKIEEEAIAYINEPIGEEKEEDYVLTNEKVYQRLISPMIGMDGKTPWDFIKEQD